MVSKAKGLSPSQRELVQRFLAAARTIVRDVLPMILEAHHAPSRAASRKSDGSLVTSTDHEVERRCISALRAALPEATVVAEESEAERMSGFTGSADQFYAPMRGDAPLIVVDPIDGTKNFVEGHREFCIAVALVGRVPGGVWPIAGVVAVPVEDVMFVSDGESVTEERISSGESSPLVRQERAEAEISASSADRRWLSDNAVELRSPWVSSGSSVYDMTGTVRGRLHGSVVGSQRFWDLMAPLALASAAGLELQDLLTGERITSIRPEDISDEFRSRLWGLNRKVAILPSGRTLIDVVKHLA